MADPVVHLTNGVPDSGTGNITTLGQTLLDGANATIGAKADAKAATTDATPITAMSVWKQISASAQALVTAFGAAWTRGAGAADANTQRVTIDSNQASPLATTDTVKASGYVPMGVITDQTPFGTKDAGPNWTTVWGIAGVPFTSADQHSAVASVTDAPTSGQKIVVDDIFFSTDTAMSVTFKCETSGTVVTGPYYVPANFAGQLTPRGKGRKLATADKKLQVITSLAGNIMVDVGYHSEA